jgi:hypothetical protein
MWGAPPPPAKTVRLQFAELTDLLSWQSSVRRKTGPTRILQVALQWPCRWLGRRRIRWVGRRLGETPSYQGTASAVPSGCRQPLGFSPRGRPDRSSANMTLRYGRAKTSAAEAVVESALAARLKPCPDTPIPGCSIRPRRSLGELVIKEPQRLASNGKGHLSDACRRSDILSGQDNCP